MKLFINPLRVCRVSLLLTGLAVVLTTGFSYSSAKIKSKPAVNTSRVNTSQRVANIPSGAALQEILDSAMIMADDYATAAISKPDFKDIRFNALRKFYDRQHKNVQDSITGRIYKLAADCLEREEVERSKSYRECFLALARENDENRGPLYAMEMADAMINFDTISVNKYIDILDRYARFTDSDYDEELNEARRYVRNIRTRKPIRDALVGVWVSEDIAGFPTPDKDGRWWSRYVDPNTNQYEQYELITTMPILKIRDSAHPIYDELAAKKALASLDSVYKNTGQRGLDVIKSSDIIYTIPGFRYYRPIEAWELPGYGMEPLSEEYIAKANADGISPANYKESKRHSRHTELFENEYAAYVFWGDERLKRGDPEIAGIVRQGVQNMQADIAGLMSRSTVSFATSLLGNMAASVGGAIIGGVIDALMVSTDKIWSIEATLNVVNPYEMDAIIYAHLIESKSNSNQPKVYDYVHKTKYYRWEPSDGIAFQSLCVDVVDAVGGGLINLHQISKEDEKVFKQKVKEFNKEFKKWVVDKKREMKEKLKNTPKDSEEYKSLKATYDKWKKNPPKAAQEFNRQMLERLKAKSENYKQSQI